MIQRGLRFAALLVFLGGSIAPGSVLAQEDESEGMTAEEAAELKAERYGRAGPFVGMGGLMMLPHEQTLTRNVEVEDDIGAGFYVRLGLRTTHWFAFEVMYEQLSIFEVQAKTPGTARTTIREGKGYFWAVNGKGYLLSDRREQPYVLVGGGLMSIQPKLAKRRSGFGMRFGAGFDYLITENIVANIEGTYAAGLGTAVEDFDYGVVSLGLAYRF